jgi:mono/diheme cytochrome c family protein
MLYKIVRSLVSAGALLLATVSIAAAGGWAVITIDELPTEITAGRALSIGFTVRQHGKTLRSDLKPIVRFTRSDAKESFEVTAQRQGDEGHYAAEIEFPAAGQWNWHVDIEQFGMITQPMPMLTVQAVPVGNMPARVQPSVLARIIEFISAFRRALPGAASTTTVPANLAVAQTAVIDQAALGKALFSAKGCVMCHAHAAVQVEEGPFGFGEVAPDLSQKTYGAEYLRLWLHDPQAVKPQTQMPRVQLNDREIEALIAFLQSE